MAKTKFDYGIIGGGLAGLTLAIRLAKAGLKTALFERKSYPFHKVCGEYVSRETLPYLKSLGFDPFEFGAVGINKLLISGSNGKELKTELDLGAFGLSRYTFDSELARIAENSGAEIFENTHIHALDKKTSHWELKSQDNRIFQSKYLIGAQGKRSTIDAFLNRAFLSKRSPYVGIKYHIYYDQDDDLIALHNFKNGYCGISRIEDNKYCLCYLASAKDLKDSGGIEKLESKQLRKNPFLDDIFSRAEFIYDKPLAINEITFSRKKLNEKGINMIGDAAGMIAPLCGNGMAMAIHSSKILADQILSDSKQFDHEYQKKWEKNFASRLWIGRNIQKTFGNNRITNLTLSFFDSIPFLRDFLISKTHGKEF